MIAISDFRPDAVIKAYWQEIIDIGQADEVWAVELLGGVMEEEEWKPLNRVTKEDERFNAYEKFIAWGSWIVGTLAVVCAIAESVHFLITPR